MAISNVYICQINLTLFSLHKESILGEKDLRTYGGTNLNLPSNKMQPERRRAET